MLVVINIRGNIDNIQLNKNIANRHELPAWRTAGMTHAVLVTLVFELGSSTRSVGSPLLSMYD